MIIGELIAATIFEFVLNLIGFFYLSYILKVGVDAQLPYAILSLFTGVLTGVSLGFFFGTLGKKEREKKRAHLCRDHATVLFKRAYGRQYACPH